MDVFGPTPTHDMDFTLLLGVLPRSYQYFVVVGALNGSAPSDAEEILEVLLALSTQVSLHVYWSTAAESTLYPISLRLFPQAFNISMSNPLKDDEISQFIASEIQRRARENSLAPEILDAIQVALTTKSQGMYLWVVLQLDRLFPRYDQTVLYNADIIDALEDLPEDLHQAFRRSLSKVSDLRY
ncbi:hypothetical protein B0H67DRAFT_361859 [Lasiosphaeris hirsuta]|uniref:Uncharacterized protein n=1 Tax=Lasiosphaeris hirsuta TaxID=260670 RepID=A0AA39ZWK5_9PEZI|nr:hypothetical protein B0H67DRAFT_361859 [Lasiosphaeris hirsuta]